ncbi:MAG TPA: ABC transporter permease subunit [Ktedonobacterales bacterium]|jgi:ABC-2 type transport system permease protein
MTTSSAALAPATTSARPRARGLPVLAATLRESQQLFGAACGYILLIGLLVGLLLPAFKTLNLQTYLTGSLGAIVGGTGVSKNVPLFASYLALELYGSFFLLLFGGVLAYTAGASIAHNIEDGSIDITLARPISRTRLYLEKWAAMLIGALLMMGVSLFTAWLDTVIFGGAIIHWNWFLLAHVDIAAVFFCVAGIGLLMSAIMSAGRAAGGIATMIIVFGYLCQTFGTAGDTLSFLKYLSPYYYGPSAQVINLEQWNDPWKLLILVAAGLIAGLAGLVLFQRRDITP